MAIHRTRLAFEDNYTQIPNTWARDSRLSRRARGLLLEIMSHRANWRISMAGLQEGGPEGKDALTAGIKELLAAGYLTRRQGRAASGRMQEMEYDLADPFAATGKPDSGPDQAENSAEDESTELSTDATATGFSGSGSPASGSPVGGSAATKEEHLSEDHGKKGGAGAPPPSRTCGKHPKGTLLPCGPCKDARLAFDAHQATALAAEDQAAAARRENRYPGMCPYLQCRDGSCEPCRSDARAAARTAVA